MAIGQPLCGPPGVLSVGATPRTNQAATVIGVGVRWSWWCSVIGRDQQGQGVVHAVNEYQFVEFGVDAAPVVEGRRAEVA